MAGVSTVFPGLTGNTSEGFYSNVTLLSEEVTTLRLPDMGSYTLQMMRLVCELWLAFPLSILGVVGNILALVVLGMHKQKLTTTVLLQALAVADTFVLLSTITIRSSRYINMRIQHDVTWQYYFRWAYPFTYFVRLMDTWLTVLLTVDRYIAVCHPLRATRLCTRSRTYILIGISLALGLVFCVPRFLEFEMKTVYDVRRGRNVTYAAPTQLIQSNQVYTFVYRIGLFFVIMYLVPMLTLIILNGKLLFTLRGAHAQRSSLSSHNNTQRSNQQRTNRSVTIIVVTIVLTCIACNTCAMIAHILWSIELLFNHLRHFEYYRRYISNVSNVLVTLNSAINFIIYCLISRNFRSVLVRTFCSWRVKRMRGRLGSMGTKQRSTSGGTLSSSFLRLSTHCKLRKAGSRENSPLSEMNGLLKPTGGSASLSPPQRHLESPLLALTPSTSMTPMTSETPVTPILGHQGDFSTGSEGTCNGHGDGHHHFNRKGAKVTEPVADCRL